MSGAQSLFVQPKNVWARCLRVTSRAAISMVSLLASRSSHTDPVFTPHGEVARHFRRDNILCKCSELLHASLSPTPLSSLSVLMLFDLWSPHSPNASSAVLIRFSTMGHLESRDKCRLRREWIHTPRLASHICVISERVVPWRAALGSFCLRAGFHAWTEAYICSHSLSLPCVSNVIVCENCNLTFNSLCAPKVNQRYSLVHHVISFD